MEHTIPFSPEEFETLIKKAREIVSDAGHFLANAAISTISQKEGHANFVTDMDVAVQERLVAALTPLIPGASFLLEEGEERAVTSDFIWIIDPIDGTQNFICGSRQSAIAVGLFYKGTGLIGLVYNPFLEELFFAAKDKGAFLNDNPIHVSQKPFQDAIICLGTSPYYEELHAKTIATLTKLYPLCGDFRRFGSAALEICYTACGRCDGYLEYRLSPWDYAGASVILLEAGGQIASVEYEHLDYTKKTGIVAGGEAVFHGLKAAIR